MIDPDLAGAVRDAIRFAAAGDAEIDDATFERLALEIATAQGMVEKRRPLAGERRGLDRIDPLPETAFKMMTVAAFLPSLAEAEFVTSGTTSGTGGRLLVRDMSLYRLSAVEGFRLFCMQGKAPRRFMSLIPSGPERPKSSLSWMASFLMDEFDDGEGRFVADDGVLDGDAILSMISKALTDNEPLFITGTSLDFMTLFDFLRPMGTTNMLPPGSRIMHTGGAKSSGREITRDELIDDAGRLLGVEPPDVIEEFGMTELFSQAYDSPRVTHGPRRLVTVPWMRTRVLDPRTLTDVREGERGILVHYDLAGVYTCVAMMAGDTATRIADGFRDITRLAGAVPRGCSSEAAGNVS